MASPLDLGPRYRLIRSLGSGGAGEVYLVGDSHLGREVALKLLGEGRLQSDAAEALEREFALLSRIEHPAIARAHDFGRLGRRPYLTRDFIAGETLERAAGAARRGGMPILDLAAGIAEPLAFLHQREILHLDLKPGNIVLAAGENGGARRPVLIDFGLFRRGPGASIAEPWLRGTLPFMAPECFDGGPIGAWTDVYALGVTLYYLAAGRFPRRAPDPRRAAGGSGIDWEPAPPALRRDAAVPPALEAVLMKCLAIDPKLRFASGGEILDALRGLGRARAPLGPGRALPTRTIGRERELEEVDGFLDGARAGRGGPFALLVAAPPGAGSSHFLREVKVRAQTRGWQAYLESGYPGRRGAPGSLFDFLRSHLPAGPRARWSAFRERLARTRPAARDETSEREREQRWGREIERAARQVGEPVLLIADAIEHRDEVSLVLLLALIERLARSPAAERPPLAFVLAFREAGPSAAVLEKTARSILESPCGRALALGPLGLRDCAALHRELRGEAREGASALRLFQETGGLPARVVELAAASSSAGAAAVDSGGGDPFAGDGGRVLLTLALLERPASAAELSRLAGVPRRRAGELLAALRAAGLAREADAAARPGEWSAGAGLASRLGGVPVELRRRAHRRIAEDLVRSIGERDDPRLVELARHSLAASLGARAIERGVRAARYLEATRQSRAALSLYAAVLDALGPGRAARRAGVALEAARAHAAIGALDAGIDLLRSVLPAARKQGRASTGRVLLALAGLHSRRGDFRRAELLFREGVRSARGALSRRERLLHLNEHAALKAIVGDHTGARKLCDQGLAEARRARSASVRELALSLRAILADVALRRHEYGEAIGHFETALDLAETLGAETHRAVVLNNLGVALSQCDRYAEAARALREAERACLRIDGGPSLVSIDGNLAVLHAKLGEFESADACLSRAEELEPRAMGRRQRYFLEHARGLALLHRGRCGEAAAVLEDAAKAAEAMGDEHSAGFDRVYRAEALVVAGDAAAAIEALRAIEDGTASPRLKRMAAVRRSLARALLGEPEAAAAAAALAAAVPPGRPIPFLNAWDDLFLGWTSTAAADEAQPGGRALLERAESFFAARRLAPALSLARALRAEDLERHGETEAAMAALRAVDGRSASELALAMRDALEARMLAATASKSALARASALIAGAELRLAAHPIGEGARRVQAAKRELEARLGERRGGRSRGKPAARAGADTTRGLAGGERPGAATLIARSPAMQRVLEKVAAMGSSDAAVLIRGEIGSGKELAARLLHSSGRRAGGAFVVVDCASVPAGLFEAELFGAAAGAFTDGGAGREGLLARADGGTVFFDEVVNLPLAAQAKLSRVLSEGSFRCLGGEAETRIDARFVFSSAADLERELDAGRLRPDLYHRIRALVLEVPPLRERAEDIRELLDLFLNEAIEGGAGVQPAALRRLESLPWPGNVRELKNLAARLALSFSEKRARGAPRITLELVEKALRAHRTESLVPRRLLERESLAEIRRRVDRDYILHHFRRLQGDTRALAAFLDLSRKQLYRNCARLGIRLQEERRRG
jgi:DNA-binding NtrC family response regulator/tetratricopeptide (TPR) repeat protein